MKEGVAAAGVHVGVCVGTGGDEDRDEGGDKLGAAATVVLSDIVEKIDQKKLLLWRAAVEVLVPDVYDLFAVLLVDKCPL